MRSPCASSGGLAARTRVGKFLQLRYRDFVFCQGARKKFRKGVARRVITASDLLQVFGADLTPRTLASFRGLLVVQAVFAEPLLKRMDRTIHA